MCNGLIGAARVTGAPSGELWLRSLLGEQAPLYDGRALLLGRAPAGAAESAPRTICSCLDVSERQISEFLANVSTVASPLHALQQALKCGTECGSCLPELKRLVARARAVA